MEMLKDSSAWKISLQEVARQNQIELNKHLTRFATKFLKMRDYHETMKMFIKHSSPVASELLIHYRTIISQLLTVNNMSNLYSLRSMLTKLVSNIPASEKR